MRARSDFVPCATLTRTQRSIQDRWPPLPAPVSRNTAVPPAAPGVDTAARRAAPVVAAIDGQAGGDAVHPVAARARDSRPAASGPSSRRTARARAGGRSWPSAGGGGVVSIAGWNPPCTKKRALPAEPGRRARDLVEGARAQLGIELGERGRQAPASMRTSLAGQRAAELAVVVAEHEQAAAARRAGRSMIRSTLGAVRPVVGEVAELHDEAVGLGGVGEGARVAVDVADDPQRRAVAGSSAPRRARCCDRRRARGARRCAEVHDRRRIGPAQIARRPRPAPAPAPPRAHGCSASGSRASSGTQRRT